MPDFNPSLILYTADAINQHGSDVLTRFPEAETMAIRQHNRLPELGMNHFKIKSDVLVLGTLKSKEIRWSGRSSDFIAPSLANGCFGGCAYCYVDRHKKVNPITLFTNTDEILTAVDQHVMSQPWPKPANQTDPEFYTYDIGCNSDISVDYELSDGIQQAFAFYRDHPRAKATFATKFVNPAMLSFDPQRKVRIRFSLMPTEISKLVDVRTDSIEKRIAAINDFYEAGYEVHVNFSPVIVYGGKQWRTDYRRLFQQLDAALRPEVKAQLKCEVIFLTHNQQQHQANLAINPKAEELLWVPELQENKVSQFGGWNIRYQHQLKSKMITVFERLLAEEIPWCQVRYSF
ncbi:spore photoproduct lyase family protein [Spirosoma rhododendri]|uniref:Spore photoproduct lyase family protein n=1 Tax=Spirosoma rhododendri TaxID=2728024 RepID=A0A7L5DYK5_9BACT|nr:spore photoproduct lyase family protein [Spirosoma rhododendri]QJD80600.1 spore photoproduct lyase family protein [Spirosoma rhododendri]